MRKISLLIYQITRPNFCTTPFAFSLLVLSVNKPLKCVYAMKVCGGVET